MVRQIVQTCYMCEAEKTSVEHAPPKCLFPEIKDTINNKDYRIDLITVPSCDVHNSRKSNHDEYLLHALSSSYTSSEVGLKQFLTKGSRAFDYTPSKASNLIKNHELVFLKRDESDNGEIGAIVTVDGSIIDLVLESCAKAVYFFETGFKLIGTSEVITAFTMYPPEIQPSIDNKVIEITFSLNSCEVKGKNPDIFWYKFRECNESVVFLMHFYSTSIAIVTIFKQPCRVGFNPTL